MQNNNNQNPSARETAMMPPKYGKDDNNGGKRKMGEPSGLGIQQQITIPKTNIFSLQPQQQVPQQLPCQFSSALQLNFNNQQPDINLDKFLSRPFTSYTTLLTEAIEEPQDYRSASLRHMHNQIDQATKAHSDQVRNMLFDVYRQHYSNLMDKANEAAGRKIREKEEELWQARTKIALLEQNVQQLTYQRIFWQTRARTLERRATLFAGGGPRMEAQQEDAESSCIDPNRVEPPPNRWGTCRACNNAEAKTMIFPCRHLCLCAPCATASDACPVCQSQIVNSYEVVLP